MQSIRRLFWLLLCHGGAVFSNAEDFFTINRAALDNFWIAAESKERPVTVLSFGDSMADSYRSPSYYLIRKLEDRLGTAGCALNNYRNRAMYQLTDGATTEAVTPIWFSTYFKLPAGGGVGWESQLFTGGNLCDAVGAYYVRHPQGGSLALCLSTNAGPWTTNLILDGYSPTPVGCFTNLNLPLNRYRLRLTALSGTNYVIGPQFLQAHTNGLHIAFMDYGGIALSQITNVPAAIREPIFAALNPDLLIWHMKEDGSSTTSNRMETCENWWTNAAPDCEVLYIGTPRTIYDTTNTVTADQNRIVRATAVRHGRAYVDLMQPGGSYESLTNHGLLYSDGVHLSTAGGQWGAEIMWRDMNLFALGLPRSLTLQPTSGLMSVSFRTATGAVYGLQTSTNLTDWVPLLTVNGNGSTQVTNLQPVGKQFFRLNLTPN
jgi:hypothetical protein